ncbi:hypothetical protein Q9292_08700 [Methylophilus sp. VKM B-3414]|uniref:hypothetical protein n=1 Tax=Methylophilus sp. VKM B-3414 TaxID=3076121 RepID=UPI0028C5A1FD|nr:hypothetical protein [Methylophilus sp. VKM B-3414]MDT7849686.1 hypothetical protein [Methylophilus sp. VKM B-3414]
MASIPLSGEAVLTNTRPPPYDNIDTLANATAVSWGAILAGAVAAATLSLMLFLLGSGVGFASVSPWMRKGIDASTFGLSAILWLTFTQLLAAILGGYLAGRLRAKWLSAHSDEVFFRDTAHGFLAWAVATLVIATLLTSIVGTEVNSGVQASAHVAKGVANSAVKMGARQAQASPTESADHGQMAYLIGSLFRPDTPQPQPTPEAVEAGQYRPTTPPPMAEATPIFNHAMLADVLPAQDKTYLGLLISQQTGLATAEAESRVQTLFSSMQTSKKAAALQAKETAEQARKATVYISLWLFASLLIGAFSASLAAACGGRYRDA